MADVFGPPTSTSPYDPWLASSVDSALHLMRTYSVHPPDDAKGSAKSRGKDVATFPGTAIREATMGNRKVARLHLTKGERGQATPASLREKKRFPAADKMVREKEVSAMTGQGAGALIERKRTVSRPMCLSKIFPNPTVSARIDQPISRTRHG